MYRKAIIIMFRKLKRIFVYDVKEMNEILEECRDSRIFTASSEDFNLMSKKYRKNGAFYYYYKLGITTLTVGYTKINKDGSHERFAEYVFKLDQNYKANLTYGMEAFSLLQRMSGKFVNDMTNDPKLYDKEMGKWKVGKAYGHLYVNPKFKGQRIENCVSYDVNSGYSWAMLQDMPDTNVPYKEWAILQEGELGFNNIIKGKLFDDEQLYLETKPGTLCQYVFPRVKSPFANFVNKYGMLKQNAKTPEERQINKERLNFSVGYIRRKNPFIHAAIISYMNYRQEEMIDPETTYSSNVDSCVTTVERPDLEAQVGNEIGQLKVEHKGSYAYNDSGYQWNYEVPSVRGKSKEWFKKTYPNGYDILKDPLPYIESNYYYLDLEDFQLKEQ